MSELWRERLLATTRGQVLALLRRMPATVQELATALEVTDNAVRIHLSALERDGLIEQAGVRRGVGKPAYVYRLTEQAESLFPKAYAAVLGGLLAEVRRRHGAAELESLVRAVGRQAGASVGGAARPTLRARVDAAVAVLGELGGLAEVREDGDALVIQGYSCPLAGIVAEHPEACVLAEELIAALVGAQVTECCERSGAPRCAFRITDAVS